MRVVICGAGQVGSSIARQLASEDNDVTVIDVNPELTQRISESMEVKTIVGFASHPNVLENAGAQDADMLIAVTFSDEVNMVACHMAHSLFNIPTKIARIRHQNYLNPGWKNIFHNEHLPIDVIISPEREVAEAIIRRLHVPGALDMIPFADDRLRVVAVRCMSDCPVTNLPLHLIRQKALHSQLSMTILGIIQDGRFTVPAPETVLHPGNDVYFVADTQHVRNVMAFFGHEEKEARRMIIVGGGNIGLFVAERLEMEEADTKVKIIEFSKKRCEEIVGRLGRTTVINGSGLDREILMESNVAQTENIISVTNDDEVNILSCLLAKRYGAQRATGLINNINFVPLLSNLGIDVTLNPRETTVSSILQHIRRGRIRNVHSIVDGAAEIIEAEAIETSPLIGKNLAAIDLPKGVVVGAIVRRQQVIIPDAETVIHQNDRVLILSIASMVKKVEKIFSVSLEFF